MKTNRSALVKAFALVSASALAGLLVGCAGGWKYGPPAGTTASTASETSTPAATPTRAPAPATNGATFVWKGEGNTVHLAGEFNGWNTTADPMVKRADGTWALTKKLEPGRYQYKFVIDGSNWKPDPEAAETADDGFGGKNSVIVVGGRAGPAPAASATAPPAGGAPAAQKQTAAGKAPLITADGVVFTCVAVANTVHLAGEFNGWNTTADPMVKQTDGTWTLTKKLGPGIYAYKFVVNGTTWKHDEANPESRDDGFGGKNSVVTVN